MPDDRGVTHISDLQGAIAGRRPERLTYFAFDLLHLDGHDLQRCRIEERKALLRKALDDARCPRLVYLDHVTRRGNELFYHVRAVGAEGIVSKRLGSRYKAGPSWDWRKTKCHATGRFFVTGFQELGPGRLEVLHVAEAIGHELVTAGQVRFGFGGKGLWAVLDELRAGPVGRGGVIAIEPRLAVQRSPRNRNVTGASFNSKPLSPNNYAPNISAPGGRGTGSCSWSIRVVKNAGGKLKPAHF